MCTTLLYFLKNYTKKSVTSYCFYLYNVKPRNIFYQSKYHAFSIKGFRSISVRTYSTSKNIDSSSEGSSDLVVFSVADKDKLHILNYVKGKSGIYM